MKASRSELTWHATGCSGVCFACQMHPRGSPVLYQGERTDGTGSSLMSMINAAAYAARRGWNYGGVIRNTGSRGERALASALATKVVRTSERLTGHGQPFDPAVEFFLGDRRLIHTNFVVSMNTSLVIRLSHKFNPSAGGSTPLIEEMTRKLASIKDPLPPSLSNIILPSSFMNLSLFENGDSRVLDNFFTAPFRAALRASAACSLSKRNMWHFEDGRPSVAMHVRRGDVTLARHPRRYTSDAFYFEIASLIRDQLPGADIHVFSSTRDQFSRGERNVSIENAGNRNLLHTSQSFDGYRSRGMRVHLDGDPLEASAHLMTAHIAILAKSSFSWVPALFNSHCVVYQPFMQSHLKHWIVAEQSVNVSTALSACIRAWKQRELR